MLSFTRRDVLKLTAAFAPAIVVPALLRATAARAAAWPEHAIR